LQNVLTLGYIKELRSVVGKSQTGLELYLTQRRRLEVQSGKTKFKKINKKTKQNREDKEGEGRQSSRQEEGSLSLD